jgi:hypothetical protein
VLAGVGKACQGVASGVVFPENYGEVPDRTQDRTSAYCNRSCFHRRRPAVSREGYWLPALTTWLRGSQSGGNTVLCCLRARRDFFSTNSASRRWYTPIWTSVFGLLRTRALACSDWPVWSGGLSSSVECCQSASSSNSVPLQCVTSIWSSHAIKASFKCHLRPGAPLRSQWIPPQPVCLVRRP